MLKPIGYIMPLRDQTKAGGAVDRKSLVVEVLVLSCRFIKLYCGLGSSTL